MTAFVDFDDFPPFEVCCCGHDARHHTTLGCIHMSTHLDRTRLPEPTYVDEDDPIGWPDNWPPLPDAPTVETPCGCGLYVPREPEPEDQP